MSSMLEQAIIDAKALREAAVNAAEQKIIEKYAPEVKEAVQTLLEQSEQDMMPPPPGQPMSPQEQAAVPMAPLAATDGEALCPCPDQDQQITINFDQLAAQLEAEEMAAEAAAQSAQTMAQQVGMMPAAGPGPGMPPGMPPLGAGGPMPPAPPSPLGPAGPGGPPMMESKSLLGEQDYGDAEIDDMDVDDAADDIEMNMEVGDIGGLNMDEVLSRFEKGEIMELTKQALQEVVDTEEINLPDEFLQKLAEELSVEGLGVYDNDGLGGRTTPSAAHARAKEVQEAHAAVADHRGDEGRNMRGIKESKLAEYVARLENTVQALSQQNNYFKGSLLKMNEKIQLVNLSNAKLLYTNRVLNDNSLNERQRNKIVEAISNSGSLEEAKVIYETLQSAVGQSYDSRKNPKSLSEAVSRKPSLLLPRRREQNSSPDTKAVERMMRLAGLTKN